MVAVAALEETEAAVAASAEAVAEIEEVSADVEAIVAAVAVPEVAAEVAPEPVGDLVPRQSLSHMPVSPESTSPEERTTRS